MPSNNELATLLKSFKNFVEHQGNLNDHVIDFIAKQDINFPPEVRGGEGGQAHDAKLPTDWVAKREPISGGEAKGREDYGSQTYKRSSGPAQKGDIYLHKHDEYGDQAYKEGEAPHPYPTSESATKHEGYDIEKMPMDEDEEEPKKEEMKKPAMPHEMDEDDEEEDEDEDGEEMKSVLKQIKSLVKQNVAKQDRIDRFITKQQRDLVRKQQEENFNKAVAERVALELKKMHITTPIAAPTLQATEPTTVIKGASPAPGLPDTQSFTAGQMADAFNMPIDDANEFNKQVKALASKGDPDDLKGSFKHLNDLWAASSRKSIGVINYVNPEEYSGYQLKRVKVS